MHMEKVAVKIPNYKFGDVPSGNAIAAQRQQQHAAEQGILECGKSRRETTYSLEKGVGAEVKDMKWYKMVRVYNPTKNILYNP